MHYRHRVRVLYSILRQSRQASMRCLDPHMHYKSHAAVANRPHFGCHSLVHMVQLHRGIISARQDQLEDGISRTICRHIS